MEQRGKELTTAHLWVFPVSANFLEGGGKVSTNWWGVARIKSKVHKEETCEDFQFQIKLLNFAH